MINKMDIEGRISSEILSQEKSGRSTSDPSKIFSVSFDVTQNVGGMFPTTFHVVLASDAAKRFGEKGLSKGDLILLTGMTVYLKNEQLCIRTDNVEGILNLSQRKESLDLGTKKIRKEAFI